MSKTTTIDIFTQQNQFSFHGPVSANVMNGNLIFFFFFCLLPENLIICFIMFVYDISFHNAIYIMLVVQLFIIACGLIESGRKYI